MLAAAGGSRLGPRSRSTAGALARRTAGASRALTAISCTCVRNHATVCSTSLCMAGGTSSPPYLWNIMAAAGRAAAIAHKVAAGLRPSVSMNSPATTRGERWEPNSQTTMVDWPLLAACP